MPSIKLTQQQFLDRSKSIHGYKYNYSKAKYVEMRKKIIIICPKHGEFEQTPAGHIHGKHGCTRCRNDNFKLTKEEFLKRARKIHGNKYDYSLVKLDNGYYSRVKVICPVHGEFEPTVEQHIVQKNECKKCISDSRRLGLIKFVDRAIKIHGNKYDYSEVNYVNMHTKVKILCKKHGYFEQIPMSHIQNGHECSRCGFEKLRISREDFLNRVNKIHDFKYDYSKSNIRTVRDKIIIICPNHGEFKQLLHNHLYGKSGCPKCCRSKGEDRIQKFLETSGIKYYHDKTFDDFRNNKTGRKLSYDFFLPEYKILIEFDGKQHFKPFDFGDKKGSEIDNLKEEVQRRDILKTDYAKTNNIKLLRIPYYKIKEVENILTNYLEEKTNESFG